MLLVIKMGGSILKEGASSDLVDDLKEVCKEHKVVLVHGGGAEVTEIADKLGMDPLKFRDLKAYVDRAWPAPAGDPAPSARPGWPDRDRFVLSKGHGCVALYAALARRGQGATAAWLR